MKKNKIYVVNGNVSTASPKTHESESASTTESHWMEDGVLVRAKGLNWVITGLFVVGDMAGGGLVALPTSMVRFGVIAGVINLILMTLIVTFTAYLLGKCWNILQQIWPEYRSHCGKPYPEIGFRAFGNCMRIIVSICIDVTQFGIAVVFLLLASKNIHDFLKATWNIEIHFCLLILAVALGLLPLTFLKSPQDFWFAVVVAMFTTTAAVILILIGATIDYQSCNQHVSFPDFTPNNYFIALGTFLFAYGGHAAFPTIQHDMKRPSEFTKSTILAFGIITVMYVPVCAMGYITYGDSLRDSIINSIQNSHLQQAVNIFITIHCILTLTIVFNPLNQEAEEILNVPQEFGYKRVIVRTSTMAAVVFIAESVPKFGPVLELVGGSTLTLTSLIFPTLFYVKLSALSKRNEKEQKINGEISKRQDITFSEVIEWTPKFMLFCCIFTIVFGVISGGAATYSALIRLFSTDFVPPCYLAPFLKHYEIEQDEATNCCGKYQNITSLNDIKCAKPDFYFYN